MFKFSLRYFLYALTLLFIEICIALFAHDDFIRPIFGDYLVVILLYYLVKSFFKIAVVPLAIGVLLFSYVVELLQYFRIVYVLGLQHSKLASTVLGTSFEWTDLLAYTLGIATVYLADSYLFFKPYTSAPGLKNPLR